MSKRVSNKKGRSRKTPNRSKVRYGWREKIRRQLAYEAKLADGVVVPVEA